jgi:hypothetical protein
MVYVALRLPRSSDAHVMFHYFRLLGRQKMDRGLSATMRCAVIGSIARAFWCTHQLIQTSRFGIASQQP